MQFTPCVCGGIVAGLQRRVIELNRGTPRSGAPNPSRATARHKGTTTGLTIAGNRNFESTPSSGESDELGDAEAAPDFKKLGVAAERPMIADATASYRHRSITEND